MYKTMKKTYIIPEMLIVRVSQTLPLMGSLTTAGASFYETDATSEALTKHNSYSVWDDDWSGEEE